MNRHTSPRRPAPDRAPRPAPSAIGRQAALAVENARYQSAVVKAERLAAMGQTVAGEGKRGSGNIVLVASMAGKIAMPDSEIISSAANMRGIWSW